MSTVTVIVTIVTALIGLAVAILRILKESAKTEEAKGKLSKIEQVLVAIGTAVNTVTPSLGVGKAKQLKGKIHDEARDAGVASELDELLKKHHLNDKSTAELANPHAR